ncbi:LytR/AlgR family response regulator transcription factor [Mucilaginibacter sp. UC70_90]
MRCFIVDDQPHNIRLLKTYIEQTPELEYAGSETNPQIALELFTSGKVRADLTFLDIDMPGITGIELSALLRPLTLIAFITAHASYAVQAYEQHAVDYLMKPPSYTRFLEAIEKARERIALRAKEIPAESKVFFVKGDRRGTDIRIVKADIIYVEALEKYIRINLVNMPPIITFYALSDFENDISYPRLVRIHRSHIVNIERIQRRDNNILFMEGGKKLEVGRTYKQSLEEALQKLMLRKGKDPG